MAGRGARPGLPDVFHRGTRVFILGTRHRPLESAVLGPVVHTFHMRSKIAIALVLLAAILGFPLRSEAQQPEVGVSYSYARITNGDGLNLPAGFLVSIAGGDRDSPWLIGEIGGNFRSERGVTLKLFTVQGGVRFFSTTNEGVRPFAQFLIGLGNVRTGRGASRNHFSLEPAAGVDLPLTDGIAFRASLGLPILVRDGENLKVLRLNLGIVLGGR